MPGPRNQGAGMTKLTASTEGPWVFSCGAVWAGTLDDRGLPGRRATRLLLADRDNPRTTPWERDRNLKLAASAPELLKALEETLADYAERSGALPAIVEHAQAIIAKARGTA